MFVNGGGKNLGWKAYVRGELDSDKGRMKLRLLDLENIQIPEAPPPVPKEPSSYDFVYHYG